MAPPGAHPPGRAPVGRSCVGGNLEVSADGNTLAVLGGGRVYLFERAGGAWRQDAIVGTPTAGSDLADDLHGPIALSGDGRVLHGDRHPPVR